MDHWAAVLPRPVHEFVYETVITDFEPSVQALISFLGLEWDDRCLAYHLQDRRVSTPSRWQVRQPIYDRSVGRWRHFERHLGPLRAALWCRPGQLTPGSVDDGFCVASENGIEGRHAKTSSA